MSVQEQMQEVRNMIINMLKSAYMRGFNDGLKSQKRLDEFIGEETEFDLEIDLIEPKIQESKKKAPVKKKKAKKLSMKEKKVAEEADKVIAEVSKPDEPNATGFPNCPKCGSNTATPRPEDKETKYVCFNCGECFG